ncbi:MAG TPA: ABC transporter permease [Candidatus Methylomirabilis sp.]|nr:ABC transporter permease [Candidatus Methylomirabilis sp.]
MDILWKDVRHAFRTLRKSPGFTAVAVLTLGLGIGANTAIFSVVESVLLRPLPYHEPSRLVEVWNTYLPQFPQAPLSPGDFQDFKREAASFSEMACYVDIPQGFNLTGEGEAQRIEARYATSGLFSMLGIQPLAGRAFTPEEDKAGNPPVVMITHRMWQNRFGSDASIVGKTVMLDGAGYTVAAVLPAAFQIAPTTDVWMPFGQYGDDLTSHLHHPCNVLGRLKAGASVGQAQAELVTLNHQEEKAFPDTHKNWGLLVKPLEDPSAARMRVALLVLFGAVGLVLLVACANIVNLLLARNAVRRKEMALRVALGASRGRMLGQLLTESVVLSLLGGALGVFLASNGLRVLGAFVPSDLSNAKETGLNEWVLSFTVAVSFLAGIVCGLLPAVQTLKQDLHGVLKEGTRTAGASGGQRLRSVLVVSEIALALIPLAGAGLLIRSFRRLLEVNLGFQREHILAMEVDLPQLPIAEILKMTNEQQIELSKKQSVRFDQLAQKIEELPSVRAVGGITVMPLGTAIRSASRFVIDGQPLPPNGARPIAETRVVSPGYFVAMGIPLREGRFLDAHDYGEQRVVVNEAIAKRFFAGGDALGKRVNLCSLDPANPCWSMIVGVVGNVHQYGLEAAPTLDIYFAGGWTPYLVIRTAADPTALAQAAIGRVHQFDANLPVTHVMTLDDLLADSVSPRRFSTFLLGVFAVLALLLAAMGIYGVMSYVVSLRTNEIGIRMALGAEPKDIWKLVIGRGATLALTGVALGLIGSLLLTKLIASLLYAVKPTDPVTFGVVALVLVAVALLACYVPARRATRVDPIVALRYE